MHAASLRWSVVLSAVVGAPRTSAPRIEPDASDGDLVRRARRGDRWAEEALYHRHVRTVMRVASRLLARTSDAEDAVQDAFIIALADLDKLRDEDAFGAWLLRIVVHQVHRRFRRRRLLRALGLERGDDDVALADQVDPTAGPEVSAALREIDDVLRRLPARSRIAWILRWVEEYDLREIAGTLGCSLSTTKRLIRRAECAIGERVAFEASGGTDE